VPEYENPLEACNESVKKSTYEEYGGFYSTSKKVDMGQYGSFDLIDRWNFKCSRPNCPECRRRRGERVQKCPSGNSCTHIHEIQVP
jgi:hypothetical protein